MGERKGQNKYYPPDFDPSSHGSLNGYHGVHALRERAKKITQGILIIRFEAPWNFWCGGCGNHVGRGVRFNAEKKRTGSYYTTPIYAFTMKCHLCENKFTFETDPKNFNYKITEGAKRKDETWDPEADDSILVATREEKAQRETDAMFRLELESGDKQRAEKRQPAIVRLMRLKEETTGDDYGTNAALRAAFRVGRRERQQQARKDDDLRARASLALELLPEREEDVALAQSVTFAQPGGAAARASANVPPRSGNADMQAKRRKLRSSSIFAGGSGAGIVPPATAADAIRTMKQQGGARLKSTGLLAARRAAAVAAVAQSRARVNSHGLARASSWAPETGNARGGHAPLVVHKGQERGAAQQRRAARQTDGQPSGARSLVDYGSDSSEGDS
jgi:coiled-coil domain-containing protein 130